MVVLTTGRPPSMNEVTVSTPTTLMEFVFTAVTLKSVGTSKVASEYWTKFPVVTIPGKESDGLVIVEIPVSSSLLVIEAIPILKASVGIKSAVNVPALPTIP